jgi:hypothetical protein
LGKQSGGSPFVPRLRDNTKSHRAAFTLYEILPCVEQCRVQLFNGSERGTARSNQAAAIPANRIGECFYFAGDSSFDAAPLGPVVVFGIALGFPLAPPVVVIPDPPPELVPLVVLFCI